MSSLSPRPARSFALAGLAALALLACGNDGEEGRSYVVPAGSSSPSPRELSCSNACSLLTASEASAALGRPVGPGKEKDASSEQDDGAVTSSICLFTPQQQPPLAGLALLAWCSPEGGADVPTLLATLHGQGFGSAEMISGLGESAIWATRRTGSTVSGQLEVVVGETFLLSLQITSSLDEAEARSAAVTLARSALARSGN